MIKTRLLLLFFLTLFVVVTVKLFYIQILNPFNYSSNDYLKTNRLSAERGKIYDRNHQPLVVNQISYRLFAEPKQIQDKEETIHKIDDVLKIGEATLSARLDMTKTWVSLAPLITAEDKQALEKKGITGIGFDDLYQRYYPEASLAAQLIGFVGKNKDGEDTGYFGIEGYYDQDLVGLPGFIKSERDLLGRPILFGTQEKTDSENGRDLVLTVDKTVQQIVKKKLKEGMDRYQAKDGCVIVANPNTGEILALSCLPDFDPDKYYNFTEQEYKNAAISSTYEPGSTFKPLVMAAGLEEKVIKPDDFFNEDGPVAVGEYKIHTWNDKYEGKISMTRILERSSNVGMVYIGNKLGNDKLYEYVQKLGFGNLTNVDLQGEVDGVVKDRSQWYPIDYATVTFGQGIAVTPIQMIRAFSSLINGGKLMRPYVIYKTYDGGEEKVREPHVQRQIFSERTSEIMKKMLYSTVENGEFKWAKPKGYKFGGKTGTAQIAVNGKYDPSKTIASFMGFAPVDKPQFIALVILHEPGSSQWGSETAAPLFFDIAKDLLVYYNIPPDN
jgi:cell division protein FtsI/penicillin-binding protein 2